ncbi:MAG: NAD(P)-dependent oxidoreductase [Betaproteobacteria bacterium]|nr:NAD(P)-dependent oxidoreductase [Betaproteobacteria bacterium]
MGEPICRHLALKTGSQVHAFDQDSTPLARLATHGVIAARSAPEVAAQAEVIFLSLPSGVVVERVCVEELLPLVRAGATVIDLSTSPVGLTRQLASQFEAHGVDYLDAPVARTRAAAEAGTLSVTVGASESAFSRVRPLLATFASEITHCGPVGCGQLVKILNNMVLFQTVAALAEAKAIGERSGVPVAQLFEALSKGSADSFALRNHGMKAMATGDHPERAFPVSYACKDLDYALALAEELGVDAAGARHVMQLFEKSQATGDGTRYWPVLARLHD